MRLSRECEVVVNHLVHHMCGKQWHMPDEQKVMLFCFIMGNHTYFNILSSWYSFHSYKQWQAAAVLSGSWGWEVGEWRRGRNHTSPRSFSWNPSGWITPGYSQQWSAQGELRLDPSAFLSHSLQTSRDPPGMCPGQSAIRNPSSWYVASHL